MPIQNGQFENWKDVLDHKAHVLYSNIAHMQSELRAVGASENDIEDLCEPYYELLESLYSEDYPLIEALETSDLVVRIEGAAIDKHSPRVSVVTSYFNKVKTQVTAIAKALANLDDRQRTMPREFDLTVSAFAKGSLVIGFSLPTTQDLEQPGQSTLFGENDPFYLAARNAMKTLGVVSHLVIDNAPKEELAKAVPDARVRDIALTAVKELAPSGRTGVSSVSLAGKEVGQFEQGKLTKETRKVAEKVMENPVTSNEVATFYGQVREIDLDAHRFDLRHIENLESNEVRCVYKGYSDEAASEWINRYVAVTGRVDRDAKARARLMVIESIEIS
jgi:hypothetical protein